MATSGENYWPPTGRTSWPLTVEVLVASMHLQFAQNDDGDGGSEDCTVNDDGKDPCEVFGDGSLAREVPLDREGEDKCACGDPDCDENRDEKCGDQCSKLDPRCAQTKITHDRVFLPKRGVLGLESRWLPPAGLLLVSEDFFWSYSCVSSALRAVRVDSDF